MDPAVLGPDAERAAGPTEVVDTSRVIDGDIRLDRSVLQSDQASQLTRQHLADRVRTTSPTTSNRRLNLTPPGQDQGTVSIGATAGPPRYEGCVSRNNDQRQGPTGLVRSTLR